MNGLERWGRRGVARWEPFPGIRGLQEEMSHLLEDFLGERAMVPAEAGAFLPPLDVIDGKEAVTVKMEIPGMRKEDVEIVFKDDILSVRGEKKAEKEEKGENRYYLERTFGSFSRSVRIPAKVKAQEVKASFKDGILEITLPKAEEAKVREVKVTVT